MATKRKKDLDHSVSRRLAIQLILFNPLTAPVPAKPAVTSVGLCFTSDAIIFAQIRHHVYSNSAEGKDLSIDTQS